MQDREYITVLIQSLEKKKAILDIIIDKNKEQGVLFANEDSRQAGREYTGKE